MIELYYHVSRSKNVDSILKDGLKCDSEGYIYLLTSEYIQDPIFGTVVFLPDIISYEQIGIKRYSLLLVVSHKIQISSQYLYVGVAFYYLLI